MYSCDNEILVYLLNYIGARGLLVIPNVNFITCIGELVQNNRIEILSQIESLDMLDGFSFQWVD